MSFFFIIIIFKTAPKYTIRTSTDWPETFFFFLYFSSLHSFWWWCRSDELPTKVSVCQYIRWTNKVFLCHETLSLFQSLCVWVYEREREKMGERAVSWSSSILNSLWILPLYFVLRLPTLLSTPSVVSLSAQKTTAVFVKTQKYF